MTPLIRELCVLTGLTENAVVKVMREAPARYKEYRIKKRGGGFRAISQPAREVKRLQRAATEALLSELPVHEAAVAYRRGLSIRDNAERHCHNGPLLKMDFKEFFPSIRGRDWQAYCRETACLTNELDIELTTTLFFRRSRSLRDLHLAIGAPTSPILSNILLYKFDVTMADLVSKDNVIYSRYADDITFSAARTGYLTGVQKSVRTALRGLPFPKLYVNPDKTICATTKYRRSVTGLVLANDGRVTIGRDRKRLVRSAVNRASKGELDVPAMQRLCGILGFINSVEPSYIETLRRSYGSAVITAIQRSVVLHQQTERSQLLDWQSANAIRG